MESKNSIWIAVVGPKKSGKTTFIEALIPYLKDRGYRVATVKHSSHRHTFDREGSDSHRHAQAGAERVVLRSPGANLFIAYDLPEDEAGRQMDEFLKDFDVVICEGFRDSTYPKIVVQGDREVGKLAGEIVLQCRLSNGGTERPVIPVEVLEQIGKYITARLGR